ncbi:ATP-binding protein [Pseudoalteromonas ardens]|uniref:ATPase AAA n=1 Tax=Pseudoalteromonas rubra TaxID=43658 RepID=A0A0L0EVQ8_9GAMM|nr:ATP-binding protein [Pseudoalteromonas sp. R96]KNC67938.1 ATPase AAA [Pseudoalteromonas rubra]MDK1309775.1 ATP-binding protein [Pseudoalteromonas sp. R96]
MWQPAINDSENTMSLAQLNAMTLEQECNWLERMIQYRVTQYFGPLEKNAETARTILPNAIHETLPVPPSWSNTETPFSGFMHSKHPNTTERLLIILALVPIVKPLLFDVFMSVNEQTNRPFTEFGVVETQGSLLATGATAAFLLSGTQLSTQLEVLEQLNTSTLLKSILRPEPDQAERPVLHTALTLKPEYVQLFTTGEPYQPETSHHFPASLVNTVLEWTDLKLPETTSAQLNEIVDWVQHGETLRSHWKIGRQIRPGYRALFHGPPGTGKTLTASVLGKALNKKVYKVDLSLTTSKYIGETEKNLEQLFSLAEHRDWILFFDEADALFGKRLQTSSSNDQFANQNVAYLLQRIEHFNGVVILASNYKDNIDDAFFRRFESIVEFQAPKAEQRLEIWQSGLCAKSRLSPDVCLSKLSQQYPLSGADIINVLRFVSLRLLAQNRNEIQLEDIKDGVARLSDHQTQLRW